jgi:hypothetical protein
MGAKFKYLFSLCLLVIFIIGQSLYVDLLLIEKAGLRMAHISSYGQNEDAQGLWFLLNDQTASDVRWVDEREFEFQGEMYDVESSREVNGNRQLWVKKDKKETEINRQISAHHQGKSELFTSNISSQFNKIFETNKTTIFQIAGQNQLTIYFESDAQRVDDGYSNPDPLPPNHQS